MLGNLPDRLQKIYKSVQNDAAGIDTMKASVYKKIASGDTKGALADMRAYYDAVDSFNSTLEKQIETMQSSASRSGLQKSADIIRERLETLTGSEAFKNMSKEQQMQAVVEKSNILLAKFAQTFSSDKNVPPEISNILKQFTSNCTVSRNISQAQTLADEMYGAGKYTLLKSFGAGTIGETYLAKTADGTEVVIKMLKEGVNPEKFAQDRALFTNYVNEFITDSTEKEYKLSLINGMFDAWDSELNFALEAQAAKDLAAGAKRFNVAQTLEVGAKDGQNISLVMEQAKGVRLDNLLELIKLYRKNPQKYKENPLEYVKKYADDVKSGQKYADDIAKYPALKNPEDWMKDLSLTYQAASNEQVMFIGESGTRTIHADPHSGNIFIDFDAATNKPKVTYIDTGNVVRRSQSETLQDVALSLNMMIGNTEGIAQSLLKGAKIPEGADKAALSKKLAQLMNERLYQADVNIKNTSYVQNTINSIMKELNIIPDVSDSNLMKATLQRIETQRAINEATGFKPSNAHNMKDMAKALIKSFIANPKETWNTIKPIIQWARKNNDQAMVSFFQMIMKQANVKQASA